ncbi:NDP-sugar synthase [Halalkalibacterium halodurans]|uniref:nucleotidyltransferase family protein n=1 Tax=Halalkalibacterium halodurans TaxID=86665 RepID=UPI002E221257|nr:NDP-sugar synthase [Halalkalibacterium halodurans]
MKGVILAGGRGTRLKPLTDQIPKPMLPIGGVPCLAHGLAHLATHGIRDIVMLVHYLNHQMKAYFQDGSKYGMRITYVQEDAPLGTAGSLKAAERYLDEPFVVMSGDVLTTISIQEAIVFHKRQNSLMTMLTKRVKNGQNYGVVQTGPNHRVVAFREKPTEDKTREVLVNTGLYVMDPFVLSYIPKGSAVDLGKDVIPYLVDRKLDIFALEGGGYWRDIGSFHDYLQANNDVNSGSVPSFVGRPSLLSHD